MSHAVSQERTMKRIDNLQEYVYNRMFRQEMGLVGGKIYFRGRFFSEKEAEELFPIVLKYSPVNIDGTVIEK